MLTLASTPELERRLEQEASDRGISASEYALRLIEGILKPESSVDGTEQDRLTAIDALMGAAATSSFSSDALRRERNAEQELEEQRHLRRFAREQKT